MIIKKGDKVVHHGASYPVWTVESVSTDGEWLWLKNGRGELGTWGNEGFSIAPELFFEEGKKYRWRGSKYTWRVDRAGETEGTAWAVMYDIEDPSDVMLRTAEVFHNYEEVI